MLRDMSASTFALWREYAQHHPFIRDRLDLMIAQLLTLTANVHRGKRAPFRLADFLPRWGKPKRKTVSELMHTFSLYAKAHNAAQRHNRKPSR